MKIDLKLLKRIHESILTEATGNPELLAQRLGISRRFLYMNIDYMKAEFDAPIAYSRVRETFYYQERWELYVGNLTRVKAELLKELLETIDKL